MTLFLHSKGEVDPRGESSFKNQNVGADLKSHNDDICGLTAYELSE
jgi:hypothetical protein